MGDYIDTGINPLVYFSFDQEHNADINCSDRMSSHMVNEALLFDLLPNQMIKRINSVKTDSDN